MYNARSERIIYLSYTLAEDTPLYSGIGSVKLERQKTIDDNDSCNTMYFSMPNHAGTHIDMPRHFFKNGMTVSEMAPRYWIFNKTAIADVRVFYGEDMIDIPMLGRIEDCEILLINTGFGKHRGTEKYIYDSPKVSPNIAGWLKSVCPSIRAIGIDTISISSLKDRETGRQAHRAFLGQNISIIEDMKFSEMEGVPAKVIAVPLLIKDADASQVTVLGIYR